MYMSFILKCKSKLLYFNLIFLNLVKTFPNKMNRKSKITKMYTFPSHIPLLFLSTFPSQTQTRLLHLRSFFYYLTSLLLSPFSTLTLRFLVFRYVNSCFALHFSWVSPILVLGSSWFTLNYQFYLLVCYVNNLIVGVVNGRPFEPNFSHLNWDCSQLQRLWEKACSNCIFVFVHICSTWLWLI